LLQQARRIWLVGGTSDSVRIARELLARAVPLVVTVATPDAAQLYPKHASCAVRVGRLQEGECADFLTEFGVGAIADASHPFATAVSELAMAVAARWQVPYLRYERPECTGGERVASFAALLAGDRLAGKRVLLTVGCQALPLFRAWHDRATLFARVLPRVESLQVAIASGFASERLIALRPPVTADLERALCCRWDIEAIVTKASGEAGGEATAIRVAAELGIEAIVVERQRLAYPQQTGTVEAVVDFCQHAMSR